MNKIRLAYFGAPDFSAHFLEKLLNDSKIPVEVTFVVTQPDRPVGRKGILTPTPVKTTALQHGIPAYTPELKCDPDIAVKLQGVDMALLYAYGEMISLDYLKAPKYGFWNIHPSLLPKYRGASPIAYPIMMGDRETGVSIIQMDEGLDHGALLGQKGEQVSPIYFRKNLEERLTNLSYELFSEIIQKIDIKIQPKNQVHENATYTRKLSKNDGYVSREFIKKACSNAPIIPEDLPTPLSDYLKKNSAPLPRFKNTAGETLFNFYRAMHPWPGVWTKITIKGVEKRLKLNEMKYNFESSALLISRVQLEGKNEVDFDTFQKAYGPLLDIS